MNVKCLLLITLVFASDENESRKSESKSGEQNGANQPVVVKIEEDESIKKNKKTSIYFGVIYRKKDSKWRAYRHSKKEKKTVSNGTYNDEELAAHASDTLARKLIANGENVHKLNFPDGDTKVWPEKKNNYFGVSYNKRKSKWYAYRHSKKDQKNIYNGSFKDEDTAAHASDTLARKLNANGENSHSLNFPDENTEVHLKEKDNYFGVTYSKLSSKWGAKRWSKKENNTIYNGTYSDEETAAHASDTLARKLIAKGETNHKLNFPDDHTEVHHKLNFSSNFFGVCYHKDQAKWIAYRRSKIVKNMVYNGSFTDEETAAHASDTLARKLSSNGENGHKLNFPDDFEEYPKDPKKKRKRPNNTENSKDSKLHQISKK